MDQVVSKVKNELVDSVKYGNVYVSSFKNNYGLHFALSIGYMNGGTWHNKEISILEEEMPFVIHALSKIMEVN